MKQYLRSRGDRNVFDSSLLEAAGIVSVREVIHEAKMSPGLHDKISPSYVEAVNILIATYTTDEDFICSITCPQCDTGAATGMSW